MMPRHFVTLAAIAICSFVFQAAAQTTFYVSPKGSDDASGTAEQPFKTLVRAREAVREALSSGQLDVDVVLRPGVYTLQKTLAFGPKDSASEGHRVTYKAEKPGSVIISGGRRVQGWREVKPGLYCASAKVKDMRQLFVNGKRAIRARGDCPEGVERFGALDYIDGAAGYVFPDGAMADWRNPGDIELGEYSSWAHMLVKVEGITRNAEGKAMVHMKQPWFFLASFKEGRAFDMPSYIENAFELLDEPGEFYFDRADSTLYYMPRDGEDMATAKVIVPMLETLVRVEGSVDAPVRGLTFEGITFAEATWLQPNRIGHIDVQANFTFDESNVFARDTCVVNLHNEYLKSPANVVLHAAVDCLFERCTFTRLGGAGLDIECGSRNNAVRGCRFFDISGSAVQVGDVLRNDHHPDDPRLIVKDNRIENNYIHHIGAEYQDSVGVFAGYTDGTVIAHNVMCDLPYSAVSVGWGWGEPDSGGGGYSIPFKYEQPTPCQNNRIEFNDICRVMLARDDGGGIYTLSNQPGTVIRSNEIHDNGPGGPGGIYLDEGSGFIEITNNLVYNVAGPMNYNNKVQNRIETIKEQDNFFDVQPDDPKAPKHVLKDAGIESEYAGLLEDGEK